MITFLRGTVASKEIDAIVLDVQGVGYQIFTHARLLDNLQLGEEVQIHTYHLMREDHQALYGLANELERAVFNELLKITGVGAKVGVALLAALTPEQLVNAIHVQDSTPLTQASGVGKKLAERIVLELKNKLGNIPLAPTASGGLAGTVTAAPAGIAADVASALQNLGYRLPDAQAAVNKIAKENNDINDFDVLFKASLQEMRR